jgi:GTPase Era involved in 16S rRNA processing
MNLKKIHKEMVKELVILRCNNDLPYTVWYAIALQLTK